MMMKLKRKGMWSSALLFSMVALLGARDSHPDLAVKALRYFTQQRRVEVRICNQGSSSSPEFAVSILGNFTGREWKEVLRLSTMGLRSGECRVLIEDLKGSVLPRRVKAVVDPEDAVAEMNENNNSLEVGLKEGSPLYAHMGGLEITVTAPRMEIPLKELPAAATVVGQDFLETMPRTVGAEEALALVPGVRVENQANGERVHISIRGHGILTERGIRGIKILVDGLPLNDPTGFAPDLYDVDWATVKRIEVLRGPSASLYGGGAAGGIINIETIDGYSEPLRLSGLFSLGSYAFGKALLNAGGTLGKVNYRISASRAQGDGYREHTRFHGNNLYSKFRWTPRDSVRLTAIVAWTDFYNDNAEGLNLEWLRQDRRMANPDAIIYNEYQRTGRLTAGVSGEVDLGENQGFSFALYHRGTEYEESVPSSVDHRFYRAPGFIFQYRITFDAGSLVNHLSVGTEFQWQRIHDFRHPNLGKAVEGPELLSDQWIYQKNLGLYLIDRVELGKNWGVVFNLRHDEIANELRDQLKSGGIDRSGRADFKKTTFKLGVAWNPWAHMGFYANLGTGFLPPSTEELANNPRAMGGFNTSLKPARSVGAEVGVRGYLKNSLFYDITLFHIHTEDDFGRYRIPSRPLETFYRNVGSTRRYGLETFLAWYPISNLSVRLAYTLADFKYLSFKVDEEEISGTFLPNSPRHRFFLDLGYRPRERLSLGLSLEGQSRSYVDQKNDVWIDGYVLLNARVSFRISSRVELVLYGRNILNQEYIAFTEPDPDGNSFQPAPTREVFLSLRFR